MKALLSVSLEDKDIQPMIDRYRFKNEDSRSLKYLVHTVNPIIKPYLYYSIDNDNSRVYVLLTLGCGIDSLTISYKERGDLKSSYMIDCIGCELLSKAYPKMIAFIEKVTGNYVASMEFLGDKYPLEMIHGFMEKLKPSEIKITEGLMLIPSKTVSIILPLTNTPKTYNCDSYNSCSNCKNLSCAMRRITSS